MDRMLTQADSFQPVASVARYIMTLPPEKQYSEIEGIIQGGIAAIEYHDVTGLTNTLQVAAIHAEASALISVPGATTEEMSARGPQEMTVVTTEHPHIIRDPMIGGSEPIIIGTGVRVRILVEYWRTGTPPEELLQAFPHLTLAQVFDALSYYQDHQPEINTLIEQNRVDPALLHESARRRS
jgi:uncharacterized protein (DUF433 family)